MSAVGRRICMSDSVQLVAYL
ncbi:hypothetical protein E2C01_080203 [Portunus trituberculatus]|uniref:Uncharacterized protein n=1 Tax=Portunus trituberculatus TaxID=210409 RepID=A0A5B7IXS9_PORTR|nr:hypothetical protein [Portunus trituberculatus]